MKLKFNKMHGCGNDFVVVDDRENLSVKWENVATKLLDRRFGIGGDQLLILRESKGIDGEVLIYNSDGSQAEMCGNGIRAMARRFRSSGKKEMVFQTLGGRQIVEFISDDEMRVAMGKPVIDTNMWGKEIEINGKKIRIHPLSMGNPHIVLFLDRKEDLSWCPTVGPLLERHEFFPNRTNVQFVFPRSSKDVDARVWERGAGETLASGSGACAIGVASISEEKTKSPLIVHYPGGDLKIEWKEEEAVYMSGPAMNVFEGEIEI